jgi:Zn-dependent M16 (insulinase) family peptidase
MLNKINEEYFQNQLDVLFEDEEDLRNSLLKQYMLDNDSDIFITPNSELDEEKEIECLKKLRTERDGMVLYLYVVKADREHLSKKPI